MGGGSCRPGRCRLSWQIARLLRRRGGNWRRKRSRGRWNLRGGEVEGGGEVGGVSRPFLNLVRVAARDLVIVDVL